MKFILTANFNSNFDILDTIYLKFKDECSDGVIFAGDVVKKGISKDIISQQLEHFFSVLDKLGIPIITIPGDNDGNEKLYFIKIFELYRKLINLVSLQEYLFFYNNIVMTGFGGVILDEVDKKIHPLHYTPSKLFFGTRKIIFQKEPKMLVLHTPPEGILDKDEKGRSCGHSAVNKLIKVFKPDVCIVGHSKERGSYLLDNTLIIHPGNLENEEYAILDWDSKKVTFK